MVYFIPLSSCQIFTKDSLASWAENCVLLGAKWWQRFYLSLFLPRNLYLDLSRTHHVSSYSARQDEKIKELVVLSTDELIHDYLMICSPSIEWNAVATWPEYVKSVFYIASHTPFTLCVECPLVPHQWVLGGSIVLQAYHFLSAVVLKHDHPWYSLCDHSTFFMCPDLLSCSKKWGRRARYPFAVKGAGKICRIG